jgi:hypothetical protein
VSTRLAAQTQKAAGIGNGMRTATIAAVSGGTVTLSINGGLISSGVGVLSPYLPFVGDTVAVFRQDASWLVLGCIGTSGGPQPRATVTGSTPFTVSAVSNLVIASVSFGVTFDAIPVVTADLNASTAVKWTCRAYNPTTTGFNIWIYSGDGTTASFSGNVDWTATARA